MTTDLNVMMMRKADASLDNEGIFVVASVWLVFYLAMLVGTLTDPFLAQALELAALY